ncbi:hypothetical protein ZIOFF_021752 [Zingiber officinale]|uniref:Uncharacterized protein n=1 Tax=Zingiber officinale TaxID=94328 RepID=A0A8J5H4B5_ZINOF|nr:hypothetical protein ZIOFF_021752 [Zingiber officinale]
MIPDPPWPRRLPPHLQALPEPPRADASRIVDARLDRMIPDPPWPRRLPPHLQALPEPPPPLRSSARRWPHDARAERHPTLHRTRDQSCQYLNDDSVVIHRWNIETTAETSSAQYILQQYIATSGGFKLLRSIRNTYSMGKVRMVAIEFGTATRITKNRNPTRDAESGGFVLWCISQLPLGRLRKCLI